MKKKSQEDQSQKAKFIKAAREHGASEDEREFDENLKQIARAKPKPIEPDKKPKK